MLPPYEPIADLLGKITSIGASTTTNLVARVSAVFGVVPIQSDRTTGPFPGQANLSSRRD